VPSVTPKERIAELLREELLTGKEEWWWISCVRMGEGFLGAVVVCGKGPTDAWKRAHGLGAIPRDVETSTMGPLEVAVVEEKIPESMRLRLLTKEELTKAELM